MDFSEVFGFLIILKETLKILPKNGKIMASIAILSLLLPSILFLLFIYVFQSLMANMTAASYNPNNDDPHVIMKYMALVLAAEFSFLIIYFIISHISNTATILVSAVSYTDKNLTSKDLFSSMKRTWKRPFSRRFLVSGNSSSRFLSLAVVLVVLFVVVYPNFVTIFAAAIFVILVFIFQLYSSVVWALSIVVSIVEDSSRAEAVEKAEKLVKGGQHLHGFMLNLFSNLLALILLLPACYYYIDKRSSSVNIVMISYGLLFFLNFLSLLKMLIFMTYTVFYCRCKKHHGEEVMDIIGVGDDHYTKLPTSSSSDTPLRMTCCIRNFE